ncbi:MAG: hypothetical protein OXE57_02980 [Alphaproteobacteria bacterium]|nr:hypothetical protein [Alphaproteobacteria bacterium]
MLRFPMACMALLLAPLAAAEAKELKPKFGDIGGVFYTEVSGDREACRQAVKAKIALCGQNTRFESNTKNRKYAGCLPIFEQQAESCAVHFRHQMSKCNLDGSARITDFTGFSCEVTATVVEEGGETEGAPGIAPADRMMQARTRTNVRSGPGTDHARTGLLEAGEQVHVPGGAGAWLRLAARGGGAPFVHGSLLVPPAPQGRDAAAGPSPKCAGMSKGFECWRELANRPGCYVFDSAYGPGRTTWSGACEGGVAVGDGTLGWESSHVSIEATGLFVSGKEHGHWVLRFDNGAVWEGHFVDGKEHGHWVWREADGTVREGPYVDGKEHGQWVIRRADGGVWEGPYVDGQWHGHWVLRSANGRVEEGPYVDGKRHGHWVIRHADGKVEEGPYVNWKRRGRWVTRHAGGRFERDYRNGSRE